MIVGCGFYIFVPSFNFPKLVEFVTYYIILIHLNILKSLKNIFLLMKIINILFLKYPKTLKKD